MDLTNGTGKADGNYVYVGFDVDTTGRRLLDEVKLNFFSSDTFQSELRLKNHFLFTFHLDCSYRCLYAQ
jgi:hypothetical protein